MSSLILDAARSKVRIRTYAQGMLSVLAHDLEIAFGALTGSADAEGQTASVEARLDGVTVVGVIEGTRLETTKLSASQKEDILAKMIREVFHAEDDDDAVVRVIADATHAKVIVPSGIHARVPLKITIYGDTAHGRFNLSLESIGSDIVKGPMGAFRVKDRVEVFFELAFSSPSTSIAPSTG